MSDLSDKGLWALLVLAAGAVVRWIQQRPIKAARKRADAAAGAAEAAQQAAAGATQQAKEAVADANLAHEAAAIGSMANDALDADAAARVERERERQRGIFNPPDRHRD